MVELLNWFQKTYPEHKEALLKCHHNFDHEETNPYHVEGDCWSHTMMVCKIAELKKYDRVVKVAALLHDIGKPQMRKINPDNKHVQFFGHEERSFELAKPLVLDLVVKGFISFEESLEVLELVLLHGYLYKEQDIKKIEKKFQGKQGLLKHLLELAECDDLGRFSQTMGKGREKRALLKKMLK